VPTRHDPESLGVTPPDPATKDLADAPPNGAGGGGLGDPEHVARLQRVAGALGASVGATRVVTDLGWLPPERQIGTTGVTVHPRLYVALGISGAVQHVSGLGDPEHVVAVNLDPSCPMMAMAHLALVTDARRLLAALAARLSPEEEAAAGG
jgi:electron transfer flavoprotein alpha subunit